MSNVIWARRPREAGAFKYAALKLEARHKPIGTPDHLRARQKAIDLLNALDAGSDALDRMGIDSTDLLQGLGREGLWNFLYSVELWIAVVEEVTIPGGSGPMPAEQVYLAMAADPGLFMAWDAYAQRLLVSPSEGNAFALSPSGVTAGAPTTADPAVH